jgi:uncharacterized protein
MNKRFLIFRTTLLLIILICEYVAYSLLHGVEIIKSAQLETILIVMGIILPVIFIGSMLYSNKHYSLFNSWLNTLSSVWLGIVLYIFIASLIISLLIILNYYLNLQIPIKIISYILIVIILCIVFYGIINSKNIRITRHNIKLDKLSKDWANKKIVIISDMHIGNIYRNKYVERVANLVKLENPDITFNLGDLIDGSSFPYLDWLSPLSSFESKLGNYYIEGNHETYCHEYEKFKSELPKLLNNITNKKVVINNTQIIGLNYRESKSKEEIKSRLVSLGYNPGVPSIILMHNPKNIEILSQSGVSLILSGHTHAGQFFPWTIIIKNRYKKYTHGVNYTNGTVSITSAGIGASAVPLRIGTNPEIVVLNIN